MKKLAFLPGRTLICGILNVTPDSFSDGGKWGSPEAAATYALEHMGGSSHTYTWAEFSARYATQFGPLAI